MIRTRFAPSPTGFLHIGGLRTALFQYLFAKKNKGEFILRIEDTDQTREVPGGVENIIRTLAWAGMEPDEGPVLNDEGKIEERGKHGPYIQSKRLDLYKKYADQLIKQRSAYYAFDTEEELAVMRERQQANKQAPRYDRMNMRNQLTLGEVETKKLLDTKAEAVVRLKVPDSREITFTDLIRGEMKVNSDEVDDQVLLKSDGFPTYHLALVVDDHLMEITHTIRGEEWIPSTPKHILLYQAFGWEPPQFAHLPLLVDEKKRKLSKREGDVSVEDFRKQGYLPEALVNFLALLGWNPGTDQELFTIKELIEAFSLDRVQKAAAVFNREKLDWFNQQYIRATDDDELLSLCTPYIMFDTEEKKELVRKGMGLVKERLVKLSDIRLAASFLLEDTLAYDSDLLVWKKSSKEVARKILFELENYLNTIDVQYWNKEVLEEKIGEWIENQGFGVGDVLWPMRVALSGQKNSPGPYELAEVLGKERTLARLQDAQNKL